MTKADYFKKRRADLVAAGICSRCAKNPLLPGSKSLCAGCRDMYRIRARERFGHAPRKPKEDPETRRRRWRENRKRRGICIRCGKSPLSPESVCQCQTCVEKDRERRRRIGGYNPRRKGTPDKIRRKRIFDARRSKGLCDRCGGKPKNGRKQCRSCLIKAAKRKTRWRERKAIESLDKTPLPALSKSGVKFLVDPWSRI